MRWDQNLVFIVCLKPLLRTNRHGFYMFLCLASMISKLFDYHSALNEISKQWRHINTSSTRGIGYIDAAGTVGHCDRMEETRLSYFPSRQYKAILRTKCCPSFHFTKCILYLAPYYVYHGTDSPLHLSAIEFQITGISAVYVTACSGQHQRKYLGSQLLVLCE